ncbi:MAG: FmdE family protein [Candidatus Bathyarchaeia archaeon]
MPQKLLNEAVNLHGHLGPFLVLGLKISLQAKEVLGEKPVRCEVKTVKKKPFLCILDGIKAVGVETINVEDGEGIMVKFSDAKARKVLFKVREGFLEEYAHIPWEKCVEEALQVLQRDNETLFEYEITS